MTSRTNKDFLFVESFETVDKSKQYLQSQLDYYKPNFVLVSTKGKSSAIFSDILPFSKSPSLDNVIIASWEGLLNFLLTSRLFFVCLMSAFAQVVNNIAYQSYLMMVAGYNQVKSLPDRYISAKLKFKNFSEILSDKRTREMWWLEVRLDLKTLKKKILGSLDLTFDIVKRFYLFLIVTFCLSVVGLVGSGLKGSDTTAQGALYNFVEGNSDTSVDAAVAVTKGDSQIKQVSIEALNTGSGATFVTVQEHEVQEGETVSDIAALYNLRVDTVAFNNDIKEDTNLKAGQKLYLPWVDGYIFNTTFDIKADELIRIYKVEKEDLVKENEHIFDAKTQKFSKGSLVLIPLDNYDVVANLNKKEADRIAAIKAQEERKQRLASTASRSVCSVAKEGKINLGFVWPTSTRYLTQCYHGGHKAIDIAQANKPPIYAVQSGTVIEASWSQYGYGKHVVIDHGNGIQTLYAHLNNINVKVGQQVGQAEKIGNMGTTGYSTGVHLHFEIRVNGALQNPLVYLP